MKYHTEKSMSCYSSGLAVFWNNGWWRLQQLHNSEILITWDIECEFQAWIGMILEVCFTSIANELIKLSSPIPKRSIESRSFSKSGCWSIPILAVRKSCSVGYGCCLITIRGHHDRLAESSTSQYIWDRHYPVLHFLVKLSVARFNYWLNH